MLGVAAEIRQFFVKEGIAGRLVVAVSGGIDSSALLFALSELRSGSLQLVAAHVNHHLRGTESDGDESFVRELCARLQVPLHVADGTLDADLVRERGIEAAARAVRYARLSEIRQQTESRFVATAHQQEDQAETVLMRLLSGSGLAGLRGIHPVREDGFIRPLLKVSRSELASFLAERNVTARYDSSNDDFRFLRNRVRALLRETGGVDALASVAEQARASWPILERAIDVVEEQCTTSDGEQTRFHHWPDDLWLRGALLQRHIRRLDPTSRDFDASRIAAAADSVRRMSVTGTLELVRKGEAWILRRPPPDILPFELPLTEASPAHIPATGMTVHVRRATATGGERQRIQLPEPAAAFTVRNRRNGDRFQPLGLEVSKKLKDFLINRRIDVDVRDRLPLLVWNGEIVWVAGVEVSERFRVTGGGEGVVYEVWTDDRDHPDLQR
ncbi:MAG: tRNA lysidine(34) synthetase TilS [Acidobacteriota bacterium]